MTVLNYGKQQVALLIGGSLTSVPNYFMIGSGSGTVAISQTTLIAPTDRQEVTTTTNTLYNVKWQGDWNSIEISGTQLREFAICGSQSGVTGSIWSRTTFPAITFDGTNELRIEETWTVY